MWVAKFTIRHDCILGNRCLTFGIGLQGINFSSFIENGCTLSSSMHVMSGPRERVEAFVEDLRTDPSVVSLERKGDMFFLLEKAQHKAVGFHTPKIMFVRPVFIAPSGVELWEIASWERREIESFLAKVKDEIEEFKLLKIASDPIDTVFFPRLMPAMSGAQKRALDLAIENGYFSPSRRVHLRELAKMMGVSLATYQEHLRKAEAKIVPSLRVYGEGPDMFG